MSLRDRARLDADRILLREGDPVRWMLGTDDSARSETLQAILGAVTSTQIVVGATLSHEQRIQATLSDAETIAAMRSLAAARRPKPGDRLVIESPDDELQGQWRVERAEPDGAGMIVVDLVRQRRTGTGRSTSGGDA